MAIQPITPGEGVTLAAGRDIINSNFAELDAREWDSAGAAADAQAYAIQRANHTGTQSADTLTDGTTNKAFLATERTKLSGIATSATANASDATLLARANHTGTQAFSTLTMATGRLIGRSTGGAGIAEEITIGSGLLLSGGTLSATGGGGSIAPLVIVDANTVEQRNGANQQSFRISSSYLDGSNYSRAFLRINSQALVISHEEAGSPDALNSLALNFETVAAIAALSFGSTLSGPGGAFNVDVSGNVVALSFTGDGSALTGIVAGDLYGPAGAANNALVRYDGTTGKLVKDSNVTVDDSGNLACASVSPANGSSDPVVIPGVGTINFASGIYTGFAPE